ncbi:hypothetical protein A2U01_0088240, partial [Trifolium medium]|nr:hypothetical protein [Trifolium medium]
GSQSPLRVNLMEWAMKRRREKVTLGAAGVDLGLWTW